MTPARNSLSRAVLLSLPLLAGCGAERAGAAARGEGEPRAAWTLATPAEMRIGAAEDGSDALFIVTAAVQLSHGGVAVADAGNHRVKVFDAAGRMMRSIGREGRGPGELSHPSWLGVRGDTLLVWDMAQSRLTRFDTAGTLIGTGPPLTDLGSFVRVAGQREDGALLALASASGSWRPGVYRDSLRLVWLRPGGLRDTVATVPGDDQFGTRSQEGRVTETTTLPFGRRTVVAVHGGRVYLGTADSPGIIAYAGERGWDTAATVPTPPPSVTREDVDAFWAGLQKQGARGPSGPPADLRYPEHFPPYADLRVAPGGDLWVLLPTRPTEWNVGSRWLVFTPDGRLRGDVRIPGRNRMLQAGDGWILVAQTDADDRQMVVKYRLSAP